MVGNGNTQNIIVQMDKQVLFDVVNDGIESGDIIISAANF
jgi:peptidase E